MKLMKTTILSAALFGSVMVAQTTPAISYYKFNEAPGSTVAINEASTGAAPAVGTVVGNMNFTALGHNGNALEGFGAVANTAYVNTGYNLNIPSAATPWTFELWLLRTGSPSLQYFVGQGSTGGFRIYCGGTPSATATIVLSGTGVTTTTIPGSTPPVGVWVHFAVVNDTSTNPPTLRPYLNGIPAATFSNTGVGAITGPLYLGSNGTTSTGLFGYLDEFRYWNVARTAADISANYSIELFNQNILSATTSGSGAGDLTLSVSLISPGAAEGYLLLSTTATGALGAGPLLGIVPDALTWSALGTPIGLGNPLHFPVILGSGFFPDAPFQVPAGGLSSLAGQTWDTVLVMFGNNLTYLGRSSVQRLVW